MIISRLIIHNFFRVKHLELDLSQPGLYAIEGKNMDVGSSNEAGKSTIFMALCWCLYGRFPGGPARPGDEIVNSLSEFGNCVVSTLLEDNGQKIIISRSRMESDQKNKAALYITIGNKEREFDIRQKDISESTKFITQIIGLDYETFLKQFYFSMEDFQPVTRMTDAALKKFFLESILNIEWTKEALNKAKAWKIAIEYELKEEDKVRKWSFDKMKEEYKRYKEYSKHLKELEWEDAKKKTFLYQELEELDKLEEEIKEHNGKLRVEIEECGCDIDEEEYRRLLVEHSKTADEIIRCSAIIDNLTKTLCSVKIDIGEPCHTCGTIITEDHLPWMKKDLEEQLEEKTHVRGEAIMSQLKLNEVLEGIKKRKDLESQFISVADIQKERARITFKLNEKVATEQIEGWKKDAKNLIITGAREIKRSKEAMIEWRQKLEMTDFWIKAFSAGGIQSYLLDTITPIINSYIAGYMGHLSENRISARLHTVKKTSKGEYRENFHVEVANIDGSNSFTSLSSGAKTRVDLAVSLAVADFKRSLSDKTINILVFDEILSAVDKYWEKAFFRLLRDKFSCYSCYVISHKELEEHLFDKKIIVKKLHGITSLDSTGG